MNEIFLTRHADGEVTPEHFGIRKVEIPHSTPDGFDGQSIPENHVIVKILSMSVDPYMRSRMTPPGPGYLPAWNPGEVITSSCIGEVKMSRCGKYPNGTLIQCLMKWQEFTLVDCTKEFPIGPAEVPKMEGLLGKESYFLGLFGTTGLTAAIGMKVKGKLTENDVVVVSGAAGATGSVAGQIAKIKGAKKVIGICGSDEKCDYIKQIGFTHSINYKTENVEEALLKYCKNEVTCYFDNVGGQTAEWVISNMAPNSNIVLCGQISSYNDKSIPYPNPLSEPIAEHVTNNNITRERFLLLEHMKEYESCLGDLIGWYMGGQLSGRETIVNGFENAGRAFCEMMKGKNIGKMIIKC